MFGALYFDRYMLAFRTRLLLPFQTSNLTSMSNSWFSNCNRFPDAHPTYGSSIWVALSHIIKKDRLSTRFFAAIFWVVASVEIGKCASVRFGIGTSIALPALNEDHVTVSRDMWSMVQEWFKDFGARVV